MEAGKLVRGVAFFGGGVEDDFGGWGRSPEARAERAPTAHEVRRAAEKLPPRGFATRGLHREAVGRGGAKPPPAAEQTAGREAKPPDRAERSDKPGLCRMRAPPPAGRGLRKATIKLKTWRGGAENSMSEPASEYLLAA